MTFLRLATFFVMIEFTFDHPAVWAAQTPESPESLSSPHPTDSPAMIYRYLLKAFKSRSPQEKKIILAKAIMAERLTQNDYQNWPQIQMSGNLSRRIPETGRNVGLTAKLDYRVFDFGRQDAKSKELSLESDFTQVRLEQAEEAVSWLLAKSLLRVLNAYKIKEIYSQILNASDLKQKAITTNVQKGLRPTYDLKVAELERQNHSLTFSRAESDLRLALSELFELGNQLQDGTVKNTLEQVRAKLLTVNPKSQNIFSSTFLANQKGIHPPAKWLETSSTWPTKDVDLNKKSRDLVKAQIEAHSNTLESLRKPELLVGLEANYGGSWTEMEPNYLAQLTLRWILPWQGELQAERAIQALKVQEADLDYESSKDERKTDLAIGIDELKSLQLVWESQESLYKIREEIRKLTTERYQVGKATVLELAQIELEMTNLYVEKVRTASRAHELALKVAEAKQVQSPELLFDATWSPF